jgi:SH3 domain-containing YSC84-like protein 1
MRSTFAALALLGLSLCAALPARASDEQKVIDAARETVEQLRESTTLGKEARDLMHKARAVLIVPRLIRAGFILGGEGGSGVLLAHNGGQWSPPCFYGVGGGSIGLQIGGEVSRFMLIIMSDKALNAVMTDEFKLGASAGIAVVTLGAGGEAATTPTGGDIYALAESKGLFGGVALDGTVMSPRGRWNQAYYHHRASVRDIVIHHSVSNSGANGLRATLARF